MDCGGGLVIIWAGVVTEIEVSEISLVGVLMLFPNQFSEHVDVLPCADTGDQISTWDTFIAPTIPTAVVLVTVATTPHIPISELTVTEVEVPEVDVNRNMCLPITLLLICLGVLIFLEVLGLAFPLRDLVCGDGG